MPAKRTMSGLFTAVTAALAAAATLGSSEDALAQGLPAPVPGTTVSADLVVADRHQTVDNGKNGLVWEMTEDNQNTLRLAYGVPGPDGKINLANPLVNRVRVTNRGSAVFTGRPDLGPDPILPSGAGGRMMWYPFRNAFRVGEVSADQWDEPRIGDHSVGMGLDAEASGADSVAIGTNVEASGPGSFALGDGVTNSTADSLVVGFGTPTLFVGGESDSVGVGTTDTGRHKLRVNGSARVDGDLVVTGALVGGGLPQGSVLFLLKGSHPPAGFRSAGTLELKLKRGGRANDLLVDVYVRVCGE